MGVLYARVGGAWQPVNFSSSDRWNNAWGVVGATAAFPSGTVTVPVGSGRTIVTNVLNTTLTAGRRYRVWFLVRANQPATSPIAVNFTLFDGEVDTTSLTWWAYMPAPYSTVTATCMINGDGLAHAYTIRASQAGQTYTLWIDNPTSPFYIEDVGPIAGAVAIPNPTPAWIAPTFQNGWGNLGGGWSLAGYRMIGDKVELRGVVSRSTAMTNSTWLAVFTLPAGYRPPNGLLLAASCAGGNFGDQVTQLRVLTDGTVNITCANAAVQNQHIWTNLDTASWSVTP